MTNTSVLKLPKMYKKQHDAFYPENKARFVCIEASTKAGKTVGAILFLLQQAWTNGGPGRMFTWTAPVYSQSHIAYRRVRTGLGPNGYARVNDAGQVITLHNGSMIQFRSGDQPDNLYGEDNWAAVLDECSRMREEAWHAIRSTLTATQGPAILIGNVQGRRNWFYSLCRLAENGEPNMHYAKLTAHDAIAGGIMASNEVEQAKRVLPDHVFRELYLAEPADDTGNPFGFEYLKACVGPLSDKEPEAFGIDLAKSQDWTVIVGLDEDNAVCRFLRFQHDWETTQRIIETECCGLNVPVLVDSTGVGDPIVEALGKKYPTVDGFKFSSSSKQQLMELLAIKIQQKSVIYPDNIIYQELQDFGYSVHRSNTQYEAITGHDDTVMALALALKAKGEAPGWGVW